MSYFQFSVDITNCFMILALMFIIVCHVESNRNLVHNNQHIYDITAQKKNAKKKQNVLAILLLSESHPLSTHGRSLAN